MKTLKILTLLLLLFVISSPVTAKTTTVKVAVVHFKPALGDVLGNLGSISLLAEEAGKNGAKLIVFPEMATSGYSFFSRSDIRKAAETIPGNTTKNLAVIAKKYGLFLEVGLPEYEAATNRFYNSAVLIGPSGDIIGKYRKRSHLLESAWASIGEGLIETFQTPYGRLSMVICADLSSSELSRLAALAGTDILLAPSNTGVDLNLLKTRTFENNFSIILANRYGTEEQGQKKDVFTQETMSIPLPVPYDFNYGAKSVVITSNGEVKVAIEDKKDSIGYAELTVNDSHPFPIERRPEMYSLLGQDTLELYTFSQLGLPKAQKFAVAAVDPGIIPQSADVYQVIKNLTQKAKEQAAAKQQLLKIIIFPADLLADSVSNHINIGALQMISKDTAVDLVVGVDETEGRKHYSSSIFISQGNEPVKYRRVHKLRLERIETGDSFIVLNKNYGRIGLLQGQDLLAPETSRVMAKMGVDLVLVSANLNIDLLNSICRVRTADYLHIALANKTGTEGIYLGGYLANPDVSEQEGISLMELNTQDIRNKKELRRFDGWDLLLKTTK